MKANLISRNTKVLVSCLLAFLLVGLPLVSLSVTTSFAASTGAQVSGQAQPYVIFNTKSNAVSCTSSELCPSWLLTAYNVSSLQSSGINGKGQSIVVDDACGNPDMKTELAAFDSEFSLPTAVLTVDNPQGTPCSNSGWALETSLDVEWVHVMAPNASIVLLQAAEPSFSDLYGAWTYSLDNNLGNTIANSWGGSGNCAATSILTTAAKDHVTIIASAGDSGAWGYNFPPNVQPADCQKLLTVGGTTLNVGSGGTYSSESAWSDSGGGYVLSSKEPSYQKYAKITDSPKLLGKNDVAADADPNTGVWVYDIPYCGGWCVVGGTSVSDQLWNGFLALANQIRATNGYQPLGWFNTYLYKTIYGKGGSSSLYPKDFHDITTGNNGWPAGKGWDVPTGLGSMIGDNLAKQLGSASGA